MCQTLKTGGGDILKGYGSGLTYGYSVRPTPDFYFRLSSPLPNLLFIESKTRKAPAPLSAEVFVCMARRGRFELPTF